MKNLVLYIHGKGGSAAESEHYKPLFPGCEVLGLDYQSFTPWETGAEIRDAVERLKDEYADISLVANSIGAYFSMNAGIDGMIRRAYFISPIVDMERLIRDMMGWAGVTEAELKEKGVIPTLFGEDLSWEYLCYVREHPVRWEVPTEILYGRNDNLISYETITAFARGDDARLTVMDDGEHWFHTDEQMRFLDEWILRAAEPLPVNGAACHLLSLLGKGKGGYSYLAERDGRQVVVKQIHHEPCDYYSFGDKIESERRDYARLQSADIRIPQMLAVDAEAERIVKEYIEGPTVAELVQAGVSVEAYLPQVRAMAAKAKAAGLNIDYYPTNFVVREGLLWYVDFECNDYMEQWDFEHWGIKYWTPEAAFRRYREADYQAVCDFLIELNQEADSHINWNWARFEWMMEHPEFDKSTRESIGLWWSGSRVVGAAIYDMYFGEAFCAALEEYAALYPEILDYAWRELKDDAGLGIAICDGSLRESDAAEAAGFVLTGQSETVMRADLDRIASARLPEGFSIAELDVVQEACDYQWLLWQGFDHGTDRAAFEQEDPIVPQNRRHFNKHLSLAAIAPDGEKAAYCCVWLHPDTDYAYVEPVCTVPACRGRGIAAALLSEALTRAKGLGAKTAYVISDLAFYEKLGFYKAQHYSFYRKAL